ncbi:MAG: helix-turn-helix transcriptional regulator [Pseudomonadales bacterium]|nr:helix-turn-helix transcriptional regulator [Pseudomonadales bacterium]
MRAYSDLVGLVYDGVEEAQPWKTLMCELGQRVGAHDASMVIASPDLPGAYYLVTDNEDPVATGAAHVSGVMSVNILMDLAQPCASSIDELMPDGGFLRTALYQKFLKPLNILHILGRDVVRNDSLCAKLTIERTREQGPFSTEDKELLELLSPHMQRAIRLREQYTHGSYMRSFFEDSMARLAIGCLMLDGRGRMVSMNACAHRLIGSKHVLCVRNGLLRTTSQRDAKALDNAIDLALAASRNGCRAQRGVGLRLEGSAGVLDVVVKPLIADRVLDSRATPAVIVYLNERGHEGIDLDPAVLVGMYGFTPSESRLSALLARGITLTDAADQLGVSINTVKTHLRGIYEKLGTNKQSRVVAQLNQSAARML